MLDFSRALPLWAFEEVGEKEFVPMVWITGPRQTGKTYLVNKLGNSYFNWDTPEVKKAYLKDPYFFRSGAPWVVFDEIHKRRDWKKLLKGYFDSPSRSENFIVTGSGKMDQYRKGGDSLQGRYDLFHLWPLTWDEFRSGRGPRLEGRPRNWSTWIPDTASKGDQDLVRLGGFPKPLISGSERKLVRWMDQYLDRLIHQDARDFSDIRRLDQVEMLARILPQRVGSPLSMQSLSRDVEVSPVAIRTWIRLFETLQLGFRIFPFHHKIHRAVKKEPKWYFYQWTFVEDPAPRFENYLAIQLCAAASSWRERGFGRYEIFYVRDQDRREVDFLLTRNLKPVALFEAKSSSQAWPSSLRFYSESLQVPAFLVYPGASSSKDPVLRIEKKGFTLSSSRLLQGLILSGSS